MKRGSLRNELRVQYEAAHESVHVRDDVESFEAIDARMHKAFRWLEQAITTITAKAL